MYLPVYVLYLQILRFYLVWQGRATCTDYGYVYGHSKIGQYIINKYKIPFIDVMFKALDRTNYFGKSRASVKRVSN